MGPVCGLEGRFGGMRDDSRRSFVVFIGVRFRASSEAGFQTVLGPSPCAIMLVNLMRFDDFRFG